MADLIDFQLIVHRYEHSDYAEKLDEMRFDKDIELFAKEYLLVQALSNTPKSV